MFDNIGGKIKTVAKVVAIIGIVLSVLVGGVSCIANVGVGLTIIIVGSLCSWVGSFMTYGFGQLIENTDKLVKFAHDKAVDYE